MSRVCIMLHDRAEDRFVVERKFQANRSQGEVYYVLRFGDDVSVFLSPERLRELGAVIEAALATEEPPMMRDSFGRTDSVAELLGGNLLAKTREEA